MNKQNPEKKTRLKLVHDFFSRHEYEHALSVLQKLCSEHPDFPIYRSKLEECKSKIQAITPANNVTTQRQQPSPSQILVSDINRTRTPQELYKLGLDMAAAGDTAAARKILAELYNENTNNDSLLVALARVDLVDERYSDAHHKAKTAIKFNKENRDAYRIAEQAAIELGEFEEANQYFLSQPPIVNPAEPRKRGKNPSLPPQFKIPPAIGAGNDYRHIKEKASIFTATGNLYTKTVSVIIPVYNRHKILANTLAALTHQTYPQSLIEVIVVDDGSDDMVMDVIKKYEHKLNLSYSRQADKGFRVAAARNMGIRQSKGEAIIFMDADILPLPNDIESYMRIMHVSDECVLIGHRRYVDVSSIDDNMIMSNINVAIELPSINPNNDVADKRDTAGISVDWRYADYEKSNYLISDLWPFTKGAGGNIAFSRELLTKAGYVDEDFTSWGCEDSEHSYRLYNAGGYFIPMMDIVSLHQEPLEASKPISLEDESFRKHGHKITKKLFSSKCPAPTVRQYLPGSTFEIPKVSIYIPTYNASKYITEAIQSCLDQNYGDLEVCICDDGSTDNTLQIIQEKFGTNPKVRWVSQENGGIGSATNTAINFCRGMYIGQLDADDRLKPNAVRACVELLDKKDIDAVYGDCDYIDSNGTYIRDGWCGGEYSRDWMATGMIATHFRMFRKRLWARTIGCNSKIKNAVDLDLWLKFFERGNIEHIHEIIYSYRWHGENTSILHRKQQEKNHVRVVVDSLKRHKIDKFWTVQSTNNKINPREFKIVAADTLAPIAPSDVVFLIPTCAKYAEKTDAVRKTWAAQLSGLGFRYLFLMGNPDLKESEVRGDTLFVQCKDDYESLLLKLVLGYQFLYRSMDFTHIYKIDDDCYPNLTMLVNELLPQLSDKQYIGGATHPKNAKMNNKWHFGKCSDSRFDKPYRFDVAPFEFAKGGYGYFLRKDTLPILLEQIDTIRTELDQYVYSFEDVRIAEFMYEHNIVAKKFSNYPVTLDTESNLKNYMIIYDIKSSSSFHNINKKHPLAYIVNKNEQEQSPCM